MNKISRRKFFIYGAVLASAAAIGAVLIPKTRPQKPLLRPPGAIKETAFLATCIKCGQCLQVCPYHSIHILDLSYGVAMGTPVIKPEKRGCYLCDLLPCVLACPSGALNHDISEPQDAKMGVAVIEAKDRCLALTSTPLTGNDIQSILDGKPVKTDVEKELYDKLIQCEGKECAICVDFCPYPERSEAIGMVPYDSGMLPEIHSKCAGCGVCEELCPAKVIMTIPNEVGDI